MVASSIIIGAALLVGTGLVIAFWNSIITYLKAAIAKVSKAIHAVILGVRVFLRKISDGIIQITKNYSQNAETKKWKETIVKRKLNENEVPKDIRDRIIMEDEFDITDELELQLASV